MKHDHHFQGTSLPGFVLLVRQFKKKKSLENAFYFFLKEEVCRRQMTPEAPLW